MKWFGRNYPSRFSFLVEHFLPGRILDAGNIGGLGGNALSYSMHFRFREYLEEKNPNAELIGLDLFRPVKEQLGYLSQVQGCIYEAPFPKETFDTIYMGELLEHLQTPYNTLASIHSLLRPGGRFVVDVPNPYALTRILRWLLLKREPLGDPTHQLFYTPIILATMVQQSGFRIIEIATDDKVSLLKGISVRKLLPARARRGLGSHLLMACEKIRNHKMDARLENCQK